MPSGSESRQTKLLRHGRLACCTTAPELRGTPAAPEPLASRCHFYEDDELLALARQAGLDEVVVAKTAGGSRSPRVGDRIELKPPPFLAKAGRRLQFRKLDPEAGASDELSDASEITGSGLEQVVGEIPAAVFVIEASRTASSMRRPPGIPRGAA